MCNPHLVANTKKHHIELRKCVCVCVCGHLKRYNLYFCVFRIYRCVYNIYVFYTFPEKSGRYLVFKSLKK